MSETSRLSPYFARQAVKGLQLKDALATHVERILGILDPATGQARVAELHASLFPFATTSNANKSLNTLQLKFNELSEQQGKRLRMEITTAKSVGAERRFVWFEGPASAPPTARTDELDSIPENRLLDSRGANQGEPVIVLITYNEHETAAVMARFSLGMSPVTESRGGRSFTLLGSFNGWRLVHLISRQGEDHSQLSSSKAIAAWTPTAVIGVGIAFGVDEDKQQIGDVLVSEAVQGYELGRVNPGGEITLGAAARPASEWLLQRIITCDHQCSRVMSGITTCKRDPSASTASTNGELRSTRRPDVFSIRSTKSRTSSSVSKVVVSSATPSLAMKTLFGSLIQISSTRGSSR